MVVVLSDTLIKERLGCVRGGIPHKVNGKLMVFNGRNAAADAVMLYGSDMPNTCSLCFFFSS